MNATSPVVGQAKFASDLGFPLFAAGQMLYHHDLAALADYTRQITQLMLRSLFGCGVVCGLCVRATFACNKLTVVVEPGVALDCEGNLVHVPKTTTITVDPDCDISSLDDPLWVVLRGFRKCCAPRVAVCSADEDEVASAPTREQYWYEVQVRSELPECVCRCVDPGDEKNATKGAARKVDAYKDDAPKDPCQCADPELDCYKDHYAGKCACACPNCSDCKCEWILLAQLDKTEDADEPWSVEHRVRRFVRPVLMRDLGCEEPKKRQSEAKRPGVVRTAKQAKRAPMKKVTTSRGKGASTHA